MIREGCTMTGLDVSALRLRLCIMGYKLLSVPGGYIIQSVYYDSLVAGSETEPLSLAQVAAFAS